MNLSPDGDALVKEITLYNKRPVWLHGYLVPFVLAYAGAGWFWWQNYGMERYEVGIIIAASILLLQILSVLSCFWSVHWRCWLTCTKAKSPQTAGFAKIVPTSHNGSSELVPVSRQESSNKDLKISLEFQKVVYVYDGDEKKRFEAISFPVSESFKFYQNYKGFQDEQECNSAKELYGNNQMGMVIPEFKELFQERATAPFFVFQVFCVVLWCLDEYWYYSLFTLFMLITFEASLVWQQLRNMSEIRKMGNKPYPINVFRSRKWRQIPSDELVAGDVISVTRSSSLPGEERQVPCDLLLLRGRLIVDEAMLTGESIPQMKEPVESVDSDTILDLPTHTRVHIVSGGTRIVQHDPPARSSAGVKEGASRPPDNGCVGFVLRTGFSTSQGKLLRTILFGVKRVTANNLETFAFILFLLIFAIAASSYVWVVGSADPNRSRYKLILNCVLILTSVVPPELPIELSLAVNSSLLALSKLHVFCTEPFRIPFAGKIDICCFDKTGTLTSDSLVVEGIAGIDSVSSENSNELCEVTAAPINTQKVLATCHALINMDDELVGDPLEQAMLKAVDCNLTKADVAIPKRKLPGFQPLKVVQRFHFSSLLKRMSVIASQEELGSVNHTYHITTKGAAEILKPMFSDIPENYDELHQSLSQRGARVLALGFRTLEKGLSSQDVRSLKRDEVEKDLTFAGFIIVSSPLKHDSKAVMREIRHASHHVTMITGDNPLTACHVGRVLRFCGKEGCLILTQIDDNRWVWKSVGGQDSFEVDTENWKLVLKSGYDLCLTGDGLSYLENFDSKYFGRILPNVRIFARVSPKQKEQIITSLKQLGLNVLMCGDGTNDVGALKHAHVGVALLSNTPEKLRKKQEEVENKPEVGKSPSHDLVNENGKSKAKNKFDKPQPRGARNRMQQQQQRQTDLPRRAKKLKELMDQMENDPQLVKMGDASIAAPFSYKLSSIIAICHIIKQGRCTLVTTLQMFKILALNALVLAYSQSVLYLDGVKFSDSQATLQGLLLAGCFLFISRSKPLKVLSKLRPMPNIFNSYTILTIICQFGVHFYSLYFLVSQAKLRDPRESIDVEAEFEANLLNSTVYVLSLATQIITFGVNYRGHPFMESLRDNKALLYSLMGAFGFMLVLVTDCVPDINDQFQVVHFENEFRTVVLQVIGSILLSTWCIDRGLRFILGSGKLRSLW